MSEDEDAAERQKPKDGVRTAWRWLIAYVVAEVFLYVYFEWSHESYENIDRWNLFRMGAFFLFASVSFFLFIRSLWKRRRGAALLYAALFGINLYWPFLGIALDKTAKAYFFSAFPGMCPEGKPKPGYRVAICYQILDPEFGRTALILNPGDELAAPDTSWPPEFDKELFRDAHVIDRCMKKQIRLLINHVYILEDRPEC